MIATIIVGLISILLAASANVVDARKALAASFGVLFVFLALRYDFGNDYKAYYNGFYEINRFVEVDYFDPDSGFEPAWVWLCRFFEAFGFYTLVGFLSAISSFVYWRFLKNNVPVNLLWISLFLYVASPDNMLTQLSAMRQAVAILFVIVAVDSIVKQKLQFYLLLIPLGSLFHYSAIVWIPLYALGRNFKVGRIASVAIFSAFIAFIIFSESVVATALQFLSVAGDSTSVERYASYEEKGSIGSGLGLAYYGFYLLSLLFAHDLQDHRGRVIIRIAMIGVCLVPLTLALAMLGRIALYFSVFSIAAIPLVLEKIPGRLLRLVYLLMHIAFTLKAFFAFFEDPIFKDYYHSYSTVLGEMGLF